MAEISDERLLELYQLASKEQDSKKLLDLVAEINRALDERQVKNGSPQVGQEPGESPARRKTA
jgi:hypothetical protein